MKKALSVAAAMLIIPASAGFYSEAQAQSYRYRDNHTPPKGASLRGGGNKAAYERMMNSTSRSNNATDTGPVQTMHGYYGGFEQPGSYQEYVMPDNYREQMDYRGRGAANRGAYEQMHQPSNSRSRYQAKEEASVEAEMLPATERRGYRRSGAVFDGNVDVSGFGGSYDPHAKPPQHDHHHHHH